MNSEGVRQLTALSELFKYSLDRCIPESVAVLGVAGGNGLEHIDSATTQRVVGIDINPMYLDAVQQRFGAMQGMELHCCDLYRCELSVAPVALVHGALFFEHAGLERPLDNALSLVAPGGKFSVVLQLPSESGAAVACTGYASLQALKHGFTLIDPGEFQFLLENRQFRLLEEKRRQVPAGKALWLGIFASNR